MLPVHINLLKRSTPPFVLGTQARHFHDTQRFDHVPWIHTEVIIIAEHHPWRTHRAVIKDILCNQKTPSGLRVAVQLKSSISSDSILLDYDDVLEAKYVVLNTH
jgi:hypothetical protein